MNQDFYRKNKFINFLNKVVECLSAGTLWILFCIPIITIGTSTTAFYYTINKTIRHDRGYVWQQFWSSFKANCKQSTIVWLLFLILYAIVGFDYFILYSFASNETIMQLFFIVFVCVTALLIVWTMYIFPYIARFENSTKAIIKHSLVMLHLNLQWSFLLLLLFILEIILLFLWPLSLVLFAGFYMLITNFILEKVFCKYMSQEDTEAEAERNRIYY